MLRVRDIRPEWVWHSSDMRWVGDGTELWRVRVDLFADDDRGRRVSKCARALVALLVGADASEGDGIGVDQGVGVEGAPVIGMLFWVRADTVGAAADLAVETAQSAGRANGVGPDLYDVVVIPRPAVVDPSDASYPEMPD
jgi:hypothetical protein